MSTRIRSRISKKNPYWIGHYRHLELKNFCLQYPEWKKAYRALSYSLTSSAGRVGVPASSAHTSPTERNAERLVELRNKIELVERTAIESDDEIGSYILKAVTEGLSFPALKALTGIPCERDMYYNRYRKFFKLLSDARN